MKVPIKIRPAKNHDAKRIYEFLCEKEDFLFDFSEFEIHYRICIGDGDNIYLVAVDDRNDAIGFISGHGGIVLHAGGMVYDIRELFVEEKYRKSGIGKMLLKHLLENLGERIYRSLDVAVDDKKSDLIQFYKSSGFEMSHVKLVNEKNGIQGMNR